MSGKLGSFKVDILKHGGIKVSGGGIGDTSGYGSEDIVQIVNRTIMMPKSEDINTDIVVSQDNISRLIMFRMKRYFDDVDFADKTITIKFINAIQKAGSTPAVNVEVGKEYITFGWLLDNRVAEREGDVGFAIEVTSLTEEGDNIFCWQTKPAILKIEKGLFPDNSFFSESIWATLISEQIKQLNATKIDGLIVEDGYIQLSVNGEPVGDKISIVNIDGNLEWQIL